MSWGDLLCGVGGERQARWRGCSCHSEPESHGKSGNGSNATGSSGCCNVQMPLEQHKNYFRLWRNKNTVVQFGSPNLFGWAAFMQRLFRKPTTLNLLLGFRGTGYKAYWSDKGQKYTPGSNMGWRNKTRTLWGKRDKYAEWAWQSASLPETLMSS